MGLAQQKRRAVLLVEDDAELRSLTAKLLDDDKFDTLECEGRARNKADARGRDVAMIFANIVLRGVMDGKDLTCEVKMRWPLLVILTYGLACKHVRDLPLGVDYIAKPWEPLIAAEQALARDPSDNVD